MGLFFMTGPAIRAIKATALEEAALEDFFWNERDVRKRLNNRAKQIRDGEK